MHGGISLRDGNAHSLGLGDSLVNVSREEEVLAPGGLDDLIETGLVDGEVVRVPGVNTGLVQVDNGDLDVGAGGGQLGCPARAGWGKAGEESRDDGLREVWDEADELGGVDGVRQRSRVTCPAKGPRVGQKMAARGVGGVRG